MQYDCVWARSAYNNLEQRHATSQDLPRREISHGGRFRLRDRGAVWMALALAVPAHPADAVDERSFDLVIMRQAAGAAPMELGEHTGIQIAAPSAVSRQGALDPATGRHTVVEALDSMLEDSGLAYHHFAANDAVAIGLDEDAADDGSAGSAAEPATSSGSDADEYESEEPAEEIIVTGTRLRNIDPASPRVTISRVDIERGGYANIEDVLRNLPQNLNSYNALSGLLLQGEYGATRPVFGATLGTSGVNLRALGARSTLVLVNGRRKAGSSQDQQDILTDISSIPIAQIERIEIIADGASAIYGADAVAGVMNIILRPDYDGLNLSLRTEAASNGAARDRLDFGHTFSWSSRSGGFLTLSANFEQTEPNDPNKLTPTGPDGPGDFTHLGGLNLRTYGIGPAGEGTVLSVVPGAFRPYAGEVIDGPNPFFPRDEHGNILGARDADVPSVFDERDFGPEIERRSIRLNGDQQFGAHTLSFDVSVDTQTDTNSFSFRTLGSSLSNPVSLQGSLTVPRDGTPAPQRLNAARGYVRLSATNPNNPYGRDVLVGYDMAAESATTASQALPLDSELKTTGATLTLAGELPFGEWRYDVSASLSREESFSKRYGADVFDAGGFGDLLAEQFDPFSGTRGAVANNAALFLSQLQTDVSDGVNETRQLTAFATGSVFGLPAGDVQLALGAERRDSEGEGHFITYDVDDRLVRDSQIGPNAEEANSIFAEIAVPLLGDGSRFGELTVTAAARYESYERSGFVTASNFRAIGPVVDGIDLNSLLGNVAANAMGFVDSTPQATEYSNTSPSFGLTWQITNEIKLTATAGESFLTPRSAQLYGHITVLDISANPFFFGAYKPIGGVYGNVLYAGGANPSLEPQSADTQTLGLSYAPTWAPDLEMSVTYTDLAYSNFIASPGRAVPDDVLIGNFRALPNIFVLGETDTILYDSRELNLSSNISRSIDYRLDYSFETGMGTYGVQLDVVQTLTTARQLVPQVPKIEISGTDMGPSDLSYKLRLTWDYGDFNVTTETHHVQRTNLLDAASDDVFGTGSRFRVTDELPVNTSPQRTIDAYTRTDIRVGWSPSTTPGWVRGLHVAIGAQNVFDPDVPFVDNYAGFASNRVFPSGRVLYLTLDKNFEF